MTENIVIRRMKAEDLDAALDQVIRLKRLNAEFDSIFNVAEESKSDFRDHLNEALSDGDRYIVLVAEAGSKVVGLVKVDIHTRLYYKPKYEARIVEFYVMPEYRRKNTGKLLMDELYRILKERKIRLITAEFPSLNLIALGFYKGIGYREVVSVYGKMIEDDE
ncbi:hypothetical protein IX51_10920 [uncultured archaeon]|nr:hypothetical protein IX51_10920 [uncultured archaeon]HKJ96613.1 N-acetyltransferase [Thermoplasmataceae archaeon]